MLRQMAMYRQLFWDDLTTVLMVPLRSMPTMRASWNGVKEPMDRSERRVNDCILFF